MAERLARMYGTEEDKVNCPFYAKMGSCRHGDRCSRIHNKPLFSPTVCISHMYANPMAEILTSGRRPTRDELDGIETRFLDFYEDVFLEVSRYGEVEELYVSDNLNDHLIGHVYVKYYQEEDAGTALTAINGRWYGGRQLSAEYSPVTDFKDARCRQYEDSTCSRGGYCNFLHMKRVPPRFHDDLLATQPHRGEASGSAGGGGGGGGRGRSPSPPGRGRGFDDRRGGGGGGGWDGGRRGGYDDRDRRGGYGGGGGYDRRDDRDRDRDRGYDRDRGFDRDRDRDRDRPFDRDLPPRVRDDRGDLPPRDRAPPPGGDAGGVGGDPRLGSDSTRL